MRMPLGIGLENYSESDQRVRRYDNRQFKMGAQVRKLHIPFLILAFAIPMAISTPSWAEINNGGGPGKKPIDTCEANYEGCIRRCEKWYGTAAQINGCEERTCFPQKVRCINAPAVAKPGKPVKGTARHAVRPHPASPAR